ncbi:hypothetical protein FHP05_10480 [Cerasibacillus terrae]|uniref:Tyr recombinase domain-containing protein n=1 Tax=Cerasibacillus terrae TaxID=2498845 RepID=A0A5C8NR31_9BACI|nr:hypothetical protein FHP05_10480 [Cerasibacillus terrae]
MQEKVRFHDLRHTAATYLINKDANIHSISKRLGHANIKATMNIYGITWKKQIKK